MNIPDDDLPPLAELLENGGRLLVTLALREMPYEEYLCTNHWATVRKAALKRAGYKCATCLGGILLDVHHISYENKGCERPEDVIAVCRKCHLRQHDTLKLSALPPLAAFEELKKRVVALEAHSA